jgi:hypothetical protein
MKHAIEEMTNQELRELCKLPDAMLGQQAMVPEKIRKRRKLFVKLPMAWYDGLNGATGQVYRVAWYLLYLHWKNRGGPIKLANGMLALDGISRQSKWRALNELERRKLISIERRLKKSPIIRPHL